MLHDVDLVSGVHVEAPSLVELIQCFPVALKRDGVLNYHFMQIIRTSTNRNQAIKGKESTAPRQAAGTSSYQEYYNGQVRRILQAMRVVEGETVSSPGELYRSHFHNRQRLLSMFFSPQIARTIATRTAASLRHEYGALWRHTLAVLDRGGHHVYASLLTAMGKALGVSVAKDSESGTGEEEMTMVDRVLYVILRTSMITHLKGTPSLTNGPNHKRLRKEEDEEDGKKTLADWSEKVFREESPILVDRGGRRIAPERPDGKSSGKRNNNWLDDAEGLHVNHSGPSSSSSTGSSGDESVLPAALPIADCVLFQSPWQDRSALPVVEPHYWLNGSCVRLAEHSPFLLRQLLWSAEPDPVVHELFTAPRSVTQYNHYFHALQEIHAMEKNLDKLTHTTAPHHLSWAEQPALSEEVQLLFTSGSRKRNSSARSAANVLLQHMPVHDSSTTAEEGQKIEDGLIVPFAIFQPIYTDDVYRAVFIALHWGVAGFADPYSLLYICGPVGEEEVHVRVREYLLEDDANAVGWKRYKLNDGNERENNEARRPVPHRGLVSLLVWACQVGTLLLRLEKLAAHALARPSLGRYGSCAADALQQCTALLRRQVFELSSRPGGPHGLTFNTILRAQRRLQQTAVQVERLAKVFGVDGSPRWRVNDAAQQLSSATILTTLYTALLEQHDASVLSGLLDEKGLPTVVSEAWQREFGVGDDDEEHSDDDSEAPFHPSHATGQLSKLQQKVGGGVDVLGLLFKATLYPLHGMMRHWMTRGEIIDPHDEFFIVPSHGTTWSGYTIDDSPYRLPSFLTKETATAVLSAGVSVRVLRAAATHVIKASHTDMRQVDGLFLSEEVEADVDNVQAQERKDLQLMNDMVREFVESLVGFRTDFLHALPKVDLFDPHGQLSYWRVFYSACNHVLLAAVEEEIMEALREQQGEGEGQREEEAITGSEVKAPESDTVALSSVVNSVHVDPSVEVTAPVEESAPPPATPSSASHITIELASISDEGVIPSTPKDSTVVSLDDDEFDAQSERSLLGLQREFGASSSVTSSRRSSVVTSALYGVITQELRQVVQPAQEREDCFAKTQQELRAAFETDALRRQRDLRLLSWKEERLHYRLKRAQAMQSCVDELRDLYYPAKDDATEEEDKSARCVVRPLSAPPSQVNPPQILYPDHTHPPRPTRATVAFAEVENQTILSGTDDAGQRDSGTSGAPRGLGIPPHDRGSTRHSRTTSWLNAGSSLPSSAAEGLRSRLENEKMQRSMLETHSRSILSGSTRRSDRDSKVSSLRSSFVNVKEDEDDGRCRRDAEGYKHPDDLYVVADINDEEFFEARVGTERTHIVRGQEMETALQSLAAHQAHSAQFSLGRPAYIQHCITVGREAVGPYESRESDLVGGLPVVFPFSPEMHCEWETDPRDVKNIFHAEYPRDGYFTSDGLGKDISVFHVLPSMDPVLGLSAQCKEEQYTVEHCTTYYLTLGRYCARYLTHKALQLTLLPPYGQLYTILTGMRCIGLLQKGSIAYAVGEVWQRYIERVLDQRNSLEGGGAGGLGGPLRAVIKKRHPSLSREEGDGQQHLQPSCRPLAMEALDSLNGIFKREWADLSRGSVELSWYLVPGSDDDALRPLDFIKRLELTSPVPELQEGIQSGRKGLWLLPRHFLLRYSQLFRVLLFWKTVERTMGALWSQARSCGVAEVFIFSHTMKEILQNSLQLPFWNRLSALCGAFASSLQFESGRLYDFDCLEEFTQSHDHFLEECFFSAFLDTQRDDQDTPEADLSPSLHTVQLTFFKLLKYVEVVEECVRLANVTVDRWGQQERERKATDSEKKATKDKKEQLMRRVRAVAVQHLQLAKRDTELLSHTLYSMNDTLYRVVDRRHRSGTNRDSESWEERTSYLSHVTLLLNDVIKSLV